MSRAIRTRLERLEAGSPEADIPVWCDTLEQVPEAVDSMIAAGEIQSDQRNRCVFWESAALEIGLHERRLALLD